MKTLINILMLSLSIFTYGQTYLVDQHFSNVAPTGWSSTSNVWSFTYNGSSTTNYRNVFDATKYSARFSSAANGNSIYIYIPITFKENYNYTITFYKLRKLVVFGLIIKGITHQQFLVLFVLVQVQV